ncbi:MAG TPA: tetratricopeptide repeat protein [Chthonomonadaceae bacterium]|nr:tetratricopeptide repeat protein [Chthonomonadaceae bacterium]
MSSSAKGTYLRVALVAAAVAVAVALRVAHDRPHAPPAAATAPVRSAAAKEQLTRGIELRDQGRGDEALAALQQAADLAPTDPQPYVEIAKLLASAEHGKEAIIAIDRALRRAPNDSSLWHTAGDLFHDSGDMGAALKSYRHAVELNAKDGEAYKRLGLIEVQTGHPLEALRDLRQADSAGMSDFQTESMLSWLALDAGDIQTAGPAVRKALALQPDSPTALLASARLAMSTNTSSASLDAAGTQIDTAMQASPSGPAYLLRGRWNLLRARYPAAIADLKEALRRDPTARAAHTYLAQAYAASGQTAQARAEAVTFERMTDRINTASAGGPTR